MKFYWYLDIEEDSRVETGSEWEVPVNDSAARGAFSVGPVELADNEKTSVRVLVQKFQTAFDNAYAAGLAPRLYEIEARIRPYAPSGLQDATITTAIVDGRELIVEYRVFNSDNVGFSILFRSGAHGSSGGLLAGPKASIGGPPVAEVMVNNQPDIRAFAVPWCGLTATITDSPPVPPDMVFVPFVGVNNKVMILFNSSAGEKLSKPIILRDSDVTFIIEEYYSQHQISITAQDLLQFGTASELKLQYRSDDPIRKYELFRIDNKPQGYGDFRNFNVTLDPIQAKLGPDKFSTAVAYVDTIVPNKRYWYCARSIDIHNNISNPTYIFEIEMVDNRGQMFLRNKVFMFEPQMLNYKKSGRRFLAIVPRMSQAYYDSQESSPGTIEINQAPGPNILGTKEVLQTSSVWGKKFKVRVTSKKTGRKVDLNLTFKNEGVVIP